MATHSIILAWRIPWTEESGRLQSMGSQRVRHDWATKHSTWEMSFPGSSDSKESACNAGAQGSVHGLGRSPGKGNGNPLQYSCLENPMDRGAWWLQSTVGCQRVRHNWATNTTYYLLTVLLGLLLCSWTWGVFFWNLLMVVQQLVVILLFS